MFRIPELNKARMVLLIALLFTTLGAGVFRTPPILFMAAVLCGAPLVGSLVGRMAAKCLKTSRALPESGMVGDTVRARLKVRNESRWPLFLVHGRSGELPPRKLDRAASAWPPPVVPEGDSEFVVPILGGGSEVTWEAVWRLNQRGLHKIAPAAAGALDPLGLHNRLDARSVSHDILVLPRPLRLNRLGWTGGLSGSSRTPTHASVVAEALDFHGVRPHRPGEGMRRIHWKSTARTGELHIIEWEEETASDLTVLLDTQAAVAVRGLPEPNAGSDAYMADTFETNIVLTATLASFLLENGYQFQLICWENSPNGQPVLARHEARNLGGLPVILKALAKLQPVSSSDASAVHLTHSARRLIPSGRGVLLLTTDLADVSGAMRQFSGRMGPSSQALVLDALSFASGGTSPAGAGLTGKRLPARARLVRRGESLTAALERGAGT